MLDKTLSKTDIIDFDYFISDAAAIMDNEEERLLYLNHIEPELPPGEKNNPAKIISLWLKVKREKSSRLSPGRLFHSGFRLIFFIFAIAGLSTGMGAAVTYLSYSGTRPVNIAIYLFVFVFSQIFFQVFSLITLISSRFNLFADFFSAPYSLVLLLIKKTAALGSGKISADKRMGIAASIGKIRINREKFGDIYFWTIFKIFQFTGLMFSTGVLVATVFKVITSDLAFGWQTTIQTAPEKIFDLVRSFALPWSWMISPDTAYPALKNIEGSQILLKDGIINLASSDMAAWWPFLCLAVIFYTIIPRCVLILTGMFFEQRVIKKTLQNNLPLEKLIRLLTSPQMKFEKTRAEADNSSMTRDNLNSVQSSSPVASGETVIALVPEDIFSTQFTRELEEKVRKSLGAASEAIEITGDKDEDGDILTTLQKKVSTGASGSILIVYESWMPPIKETVDYIKSVRDHAGKRTPITIWLTGKPAPDSSGYSDVEENDFKVWNWKIQAMGDTNLSLTAGGK